MKKNNTQTKEKRIKPKVHKCMSYIFTIPDQKMDTCFIKVYMIELNDTWGNTSPKNVTECKFEYCPYCGEKLVEIYEEETSENGK